MLQQLCMMYTHVAHTTLCMATLWPWRVTSNDSFANPPLATCYTCIFSRFSGLGTLSLDIAGCFYLPSITVHGCRVQTHL